MFLFNFDVSFHDPPLSYSVYSFNRLLTGPTQKLKKPGQTCSLVPFENFPLTRRASTQNFLLNLNLCRPSCSSRVRLHWGNYFYAPSLHTIKTSVLELNPGDMSTPSSQLNRRHTTSLPLRVDLNPVRTVLVSEILGAGSLPLVPRIKSLTTLPGPFQLLHLFPPSLLLLPHLVLYESSVFTVLYHKPTDITDFLSFWYLTIDLCRLSLTEIWCTLS